MVLSEWYEWIKGDDLKQGDIILNCPVFLPSKDLKWPIDVEKDNPMDFFPKM